MPKFDASQDRLWVQTATATVFACPNGQGNLGLPGSRGTIDSSDKQSWPYNTYAAGALDQSISLDVTPDYPDAALTRMEALFKSGTAEIYQIRKGGATGNGTTDRQWECSMIVSQFAKTFNKGELRKLSITLVPAAAPSIDAYS